ncbi:MarR family transcriptional regulator [Paracoccus sp. S-4012]|uniref:MarR family winged helix-turn-helix transcriptional regulator n=1 Tax=Paracoccus sp. S-4012 TaxID=2665648 RepID=UPI0012AFD872|nr:MarR family winged helix-turn-helix transcriptional regulator [Paracoccus sp. S-4012]MRX48993.1 MarR family transcriptional regulator [Paracoccus sp. S-4012]
MTAPLDPNKPAAGQEFLPDYLLFLLATASAAASEGFHARARQAGLRVPEWRVLGSLHDQDGQMITRLAQLSLMEQSRLTRVVERMVDRGLVIRQGDAGDRRRVRVWMTDEGRALARRVVAEARSHEAGLIALLGEAEGRQLKDLLKRLHHLASEAEGSAPHPALGPAVAEDA